jgi:molybdate transport system regulatory protein
VNKLIGKIILVETSSHMSMVDIDVDGDVFSSIVLETPATAPYLKQGSSVTLLFKETEVSIGKNLSGLISLRNRFKATIKGLEKSDILTKVILNYKSNAIVSIISSRSAQKLGLIDGDDVEWLVKTNEVSLLKVEG